MTVRSGTWLEEKWAPISYFGGTYYEISNIGRCRSLPRKSLIVRRGKKVVVRTQMRYLVPKPHYQGYVNYRFQLGGKIVLQSAHRLVAKAFIPNPSDKPYVNHIDHNPRNNGVDNLEWVTHAENLQHSANAKRGGGQYGAQKLGPEDRIHLIYLAQRGLNYSQIGRALGMDNTSIQRYFRKHIL